MAKTPEWFEKLAAQGIPCAMFGEHGETLASANGFDELVDGECPRWDPPSDEELAQPPKPPPAGSYYYKAPGEAAPPNLICCYCRRAWQPTEREWYVTLPEHTNNEEAMQVRASMLEMLRNKPDLLECGRCRR